MTYPLVHFSMVQSMHHHGLNSVQPYPRRTCSCIGDSTCTRFMEILILHNIIQQREVWGNCLVEIYFGYEWISLSWKFLKCTLLSIQKKYYDLQCRPPMLYTLVWNTLCTYSIIFDVFSVGFLVFSVTHVINHDH